MLLAEKFDEALAGIPGDEIERDFGVKLHIICTKIAAVAEDQVVGGRREADFEGLHRGC